MKYIFITIVFFVITNGNAQNSIDSILADIAKNNKSIISTQQYWEAKKTNYKVGLAPNNPKVEYEYLPGSPAGAGTQTDLFIIQEFDFPTAYIKKRQVANEQIAQIEFRLIAHRQDILLQAKQYCIELIYLNKQQIELNKRLLNAEKLYKNYTLKFDKGDASSLDMNKANLQLIKVQNEVSLNTSEVKQYNQKLTELNGGTEIIFTETIYPLTPTIPDFKTLENTIEDNDPNLKSFYQQQKINQKKKELSRAMSLPKIEGGYRTQELLGQTFRGVHLGVTIPLWGNKNTVKYQREQLRFSELQIEEHNTEHFYEIKQLYEKHETLKITFDKYQQLFSNQNNTELLDKSLKLGEISSIQYFIETNYFYESYDEYLELEKEYHQVIAELYKYKL
ncbi:MAG: transporter [Flavobacteriales bacterium]|nr:MAG: transporter [Flavobacteriales bacterium]